jgi:hypothetical protein
MSIQTQEWTLVWLNCGLMSAGAWLAGRRARPGIPSGRWLAVSVFFGSCGSVLSNLPRLLGWPHGVVLTLDTVAFLPFAAALAAAVWAWHSRRGSPDSRGR